MSTVLYKILRLPPALRYQAICPFVVRAAESHSVTGVTRRTFSCANISSKQTRATRPPQASKSAPTLSRKPLSLPATKPIAQPLRPSPPNASRSRNAYVNTLLQRSNGEQVLLYRAPSHTSFFIGSYLFGSALVIAAVIQANLTKEDKQGQPKMPWWTKFLTLVPAVFCVILATTCLVAPWKMIQTVSLVAKGGSSEVLIRFEVRPPLPLVKFGGGTIEAPLHQVYLDRNVTAQDLRYFTIPLEDAKGFTESSLHPSKERRSFSSRLGDFNRAVLNSWPALLHNTRRMLMRDGMTYVRIAERGNWKLDLQGCEMLDHGKALERVVVVDPNLDRSLLGKLKALTG